MSTVINSIHIQALNNIKWHSNQSELTQKCQESIDILEEVLEKADQIEENILTDLKDTLDKLQKLKEAYELVLGGNLPQTEQNKYAGIIAAIRSELGTKLNKLDS